MRDQECVMCKKDIDTEKDNYKVGESLEEYWCKKCAINEKLQEIEDYVESDSRISENNYKWLIQTVKELKEQLENEVDSHINKSRLLYKAHRRIKELQAENEKLTKVYRKGWEEKDRQLKQVNEKLERYEEALRFYAEEKHYDMIQVNAVYEEVVLDRGEVAKKALEDEIE